MGIVGNNFPEIRERLTCAGSMSEEKDTPELGTPLEEASESNDKFDKDNSKLSEVVAPGNSLPIFTQFAGPMYILPIF